MKYQYMPALTDDEILALREDIAQNGMLHPIIVDEKGRILDGHHRAAIAAELGFKPERHVMQGLTEVEKRTVAFRLNTGRRHMNREQRRAVVVESLKADPELSDRQHGRRCGVDNKTVATVRAELAGREEIPHVDTRTDAAGRQQPASRPDHSPGPASEADGQLDAPVRTGEHEAEGAGRTPEAADSSVEDSGEPSTDGEEELRVPALQPDSSDAAGAPVDFPAAGAPVDPLDDPDEVERQHRIRSSESVAKALATLLLRLDPDPIGWLETTWMPDAFRERDLPRVRDAFTADGLRRIAKHIESIADRVDRDGGVL